MKKYIVNLLFILLYVVGTAQEYKEMPFYDPYSYGQIIPALDALEGNFNYLTQENIKRELGRNTAYLSRVYHSTLITTVATCKLYLIDHLTYLHGPEAILRSNNDLVVEVPKLMIPRDSLIYFAERLGYKNLTLKEGNDTYTCSLQTPAFHYWYSRNYTEYHMVIYN